MLIIDAYHILCFNKSDKDLSLKGIGGFTSRIYCTESFM